MDDEERLEDLFSPETIGALDELQENVELDLHPQAEMALEETIQYTIEDLHDEAFDSGFDAGHEEGIRQGAELGIMVGRLEVIHAMVVEGPDIERLAELVEETNQFFTEE